MARSLSQPAFLPAGLKQFLARRSVECAGLALFALAAALAAALASFNLGDPTFNLATDRAPTNLLGRGGAYAADLMLQTLGAASVVLVLALTTWSWRLISHRGLPRWWLNLALVPAVATLFAIAAAAVPCPWACTCRTCDKHQADAQKTTQRSQLAANHGRSLYLEWATIFRGAPRLEARHRLGQ